MTDIESIKKKVKGSIKKNFLLSKINWFNTGGNAEIFFEPTDKEDLSTFLKNIDQNIPINLIGAGSNLLIRDNGVKGAIIKLGEGFKNIEKIDKNTIKTGGGIKNMKLSEATAKLGISNFEFLSGIPGTIGGSMFMNAGAYGKEIKDILIEAELIDRKGKIYNLQNKDIGYVYRGNTMCQDMFFISGVFQGVSCTVENIRNNIKKMKEHRANTQPVNNRTGGSTFKNPSNETKAWEVIKKSGCHNMTEGGAKISEKHCNFIINTGNATTRDIETLGNKVIRKVKQETGITLEWEIKILGEQS